nr:hypothetical protein [Tanacetum cinerariifolium]
MEKPKNVRPSSPIIEDWESDSDDDCEIRPSIKQNKPSHAKINIIKSYENTRKSVIESYTYKQAENLRNRKSVLNNEGKATSQREVRPIWSNAKRVNHQNFYNNLTHPHPRRNFVLTAVITNSGKVLVNTAKQSSPRAASSTNTARYVNTTATRPTVNGAKPSSNVFHKSHSPITRTFNQRTTPKNSILEEKINTAKVNNVTTAGTKAVVSAVQGNGENVVKFLQLFMRNQIALEEPFNDVYVTPAKKVFTNMKRQNKDFSGTITLLFDTMLVPPVVEGEGSGQPSKPQSPSSTTPLEQVLVVVGDEAVYTGEDDRVVRAATTTASLEAEQESSRPRHHVTTLGDTVAQTRFETASKQSYDPPLSEANTSGSREDSMEHQNDLTDFVPPTPHDSPLSGGMKLFKIRTSKKNTLDKGNVSKQERDECNKREELNLSDKGSGETKVFDYTTAAEKDVNTVKLVSTAGDAVNAAIVIPDVSTTSPSTSAVGPFINITEDIFEDEMTTMADTLMAIRRIRPRKTLVNWYGTPRESLRESEETMSARRSERQPKDRRRSIWHGNRLLYHEGRNVHTKRMKIRTWNE